MSEASDQAELEVLEAMSKVAQILGHQIEQGIILSVRDIKELPRRLRFFGGQKVRMNHVGDVRKIA